MNTVTKLAAVCAVAALPGMAQAVTVNLSFFDGASDIADARAAKAGFFNQITATEDFEGFNASNAAAPAAVGTSTDGGLSTAVGTFTTVASSRPGRSALGPTNESVVRNDAAFTFSRFNTTSGGTKWLDSNDNKSVVLDITGTGTANAIAFFLTDVEDVGGLGFTIAADGGSGFSTVYNIQDEVTSNLADGNLILALIDFGIGNLASDYIVSLSIDERDGFGVDDIVAGSTEEVNPVPIPASWLLLMGAVGGLGLARRMRQKA